MSDTVMRGPLAGMAEAGPRVLAVDGSNCELAQMSFAGMLNLRGAAQDTAFATAVRGATGMDLPLRPNSAALNADSQLLWLGPDEWLLKLRATGAAAMEAALRSALPGQHFSVVDVSSGYTTLVLQGPAAADLLARGCPLDLHQRAFAAGALAQTHKAKASVVIFRPLASPCYEITVRRSFAEYLFHWLCKAGQ
jgi:sarcosine oxidase subunit gamma